MNSSLSHVFHFLLSPFMDPTNLAPPPFFSEWCLGETTFFLILSGVFLTRASSGTPFLVACPLLTGKRIRLFGPFPVLCIPLGFFPGMSFFLYLLRPAEVPLFSYPLFSFSSFLSNGRYLSVYVPLPVGANVGSNLLFQYFPVPGCPTLHSTSLQNTTWPSSPCVVLGWPLPVVLPISSATFLVFFFFLRLPVLQYPCTCLLLGFL